MKAFPSGNGCRDPKQADRNNSGRLAQSPQVLICPPPLLGHHPMVTSLLDQSKVIIRPMKDGDGKRTFELGPIVTLSCHPWDSNAKVKPNQPNPLQQDSPIPSLPHEQTLRQPTPGPSGTQWSEDLFHGKQPEFNLISTFSASELTVPHFLEPAQMDEPPITGPSPSSKPHEDIPTCEPEPEVAPTQSMKEPFGKYQLSFFYFSRIFLTFPLTISSSSHSTPLHHHHQQYTHWIPPPLSHSLTLPPSPHVPPPSTPTPVPSSPHSHNDARQEFTNL
ncbi:hypothetical protein O181_055427 [Austropuccinia psidii MF-1]|uniref:Uncharacterized protein n=1 Tax=Austropuccinia psidii MF-1 TaxID=1389203 RepID=A0A9Q3HTG1_9BASI|nr:hypothetical protein [Austropuccinia psidii MF-1]